MARIWCAVFFLSGQLIFSSCLFQYHFVNQPLTWTEAQTYCRQTYTDLVTVQSSEEITQLLNGLSSVGHDSEVWIGLFSEIHWYWSDGFVGTGADYRNWAPSNDEPNFASASQFCVCTDANGTWWDDFCSNQYPFLCNNGTDLDPKYVYVEEKMSWFSAQDVCMENFTDLATVRNDTENQMAQNLVPFGSHPWIGLFNIPDIYWSDGSTFFFSNWENVYNPIGSMTVICGVTSIKGSGRFKLFPCETQLPFVCYSPRPEIKKQVVKLRLKMEDSVDLNEPVLKANILKKLQDKLEEGGVILKWREQLDGDIFKKETNIKKTNL